MANKHTCMCVCFNYIYRETESNKCWQGYGETGTLLNCIGDHAPARRKKALTRSLSKSLLMLETSKIPMFTCHPHHSSLALNVATLHANLNTLSFSPKQTDGVCWAGWICHTMKEILWPILCHWNMLLVVTIFLKKISEMSLITQKLARSLWPVIYL